LKNINNINVIAEVGLAHEGSMTLAMSYIDAISAAGADAVKFQTHIAESESTIFDKFRVKSKYVTDKNRLDYWKRTSFKKHEWKRLKKYSEKKGLLFMSSPFSFEAVDILDDLKIKVWKIGSGEVNNLPLIEKIAKTKKPIFLSSGMSTYNELDKIIKVIKRYHQKIILMQCTSLYPCPPERSGLSLIKDFKKKFDFPIGYSDHTAKVGIQLAAISLGAQVIETHVIFDKKIQTFDSSVSIDFHELKFLCEQIKEIKKAIKSKSSKINLNKDLVRNKFLFEKGIYLKVNLKKNEKIKFDYLDFKKPAIGIKAIDYKKILNKKIKRNAKLGDPLKKKDIL